MNRDGSCEDAKVTIKDLQKHFIVQSVNKEGKQNKKGKNKGDDYLNMPNGGYVGGNMMGFDQRNYQIFGGNIANCPSCIVNYNGKK